MGEQRCSYIFIHTLCNIVTRVSSTVICSFISQAMKFSVMDCESFGAGTLGTPDPTVHFDGDPDHFFMLKLINSCLFSYKKETAKFTTEMQIKNNFWRSKFKRTIFVNV